MNTRLAEFFAHRTIPIVTKHKKEHVIGPLLEDRLGCTTLGFDSFDTDLLGTFTGERKRILSPLDAALEKCKTAISLGGYDCAIASEGTFGHFPPMAFVPSDQELVVFYDQLNNLTVLGFANSYETNAGEEIATDWQSLEHIARDFGFPQSWVILKEPTDTSDPNHQPNIWKDIDSWDKLHHLWTSISHKQPEAQFIVTPDFRAMANPLRRKVIAEATMDLIKHLTTLCPNCEMPGFKPTNVIRGLPCCFCGLPTDGILAQVYTCSHCSYEEQKKDSTNGKDCQDPAYCQFCNP
jgi:hypothetical protein